MKTIKKFKDEHTRRDSKKKLKPKKKKKSLKPHKNNHKAESYDYFLEEE